MADPKKPHDHPSQALWELAESTTVAELTASYEQAWQQAQANPKRGQSDHFPALESFLVNIDEELKLSALLGLLRTDMGLRREAGENITADWYFQRYPQLHEEIRVALIYEEFCLSEEIHSPQDNSPENYYQRFPELRDRLQRLLEIHDFFSAAAKSFELDELSQRSTASWSFSQPTAQGDPLAKPTPFPKPGEQIGSFELIAMLGKGSFAKVFLAHDQNLAKREVALKVSRVSSGEAHILAKLQHSHIMPVYSTYIDQASGFYLICMPYRGSATLSSVMASPGVRISKTSKNLLRSLDQQPQPQPLSEPPAFNEPPSPIRTMLESLDDYQVLAWWMAKIAEALQHAHDRGILHLDLKPTNILITSDGSPMLLDFNLASDAQPFDKQFIEKLGGTAAYMAPEHLDAIRRNQTKDLNHQTDIYALGTVFYEALTGQRPHSTPRSMTHISKALEEMARQRRLNPPSVATRNLETPTALATIVDRCLAGNPSARYARAGDLAEDLAAYLSNQSLRHAHEPILSRSQRWVQRRRKRLLWLLPAIAAIGCAFFFVRQNLQHIQNETDIASWAITEGQKHFENRDYGMAEELFNLAAGIPTRDQIIQGKIDEFQKRSQAKNLFPLKLQEIRLEAAQKANDSHQGQRILTLAKRLESLSPRLRMAVLGPEREHLDQAFAEFFDLLEQFSLTQINGLGQRVWKSPWTKPVGFELLSKDQNQSLLNEIEHLLFMYATHLQKNIITKQNIVLEDLHSLIDAAILSVPDPTPWQALQGLLNDKQLANIPKSSKSSKSCLLWATLLWSQNQHYPAWSWLRQAVTQDDKDPWGHYQLAMLCEQFGEVHSAERHYHLAAALLPQSPWPHCDLARLLIRRNICEQTLEEITTANQIARLQGREIPLATHLEAQVLRSVGRFEEARSLWTRILPAKILSDLGYSANPQSLGSSTPIHAQITAEAFLGLAELEWSSNRTKTALALCDQFLKQSPENLAASFLRAKLLMEFHRWKESLLELDLVINGFQKQQETTTNPLLPAAQTNTRSTLSIPNLLDARIAVFMALGDYDHALRDAQRLVRLDPTQSSILLLDRVLLAANQSEDVVSLWPNDFESMPSQGRDLAPDFHRAVEKLATKASQTQDPLQISRFRLRQIALLSALKQHREALALAEQEIKSNKMDLTKCMMAQVYLRSGQIKQALDEIKELLESSPSVPFFHEIYGQILLKANRLNLALNEFRLVTKRQPSFSSYQNLAKTLNYNQQHIRAVKIWESAKTIEPDHPLGHLGQAESFLGIQFWDRAATSLEQAAKLAWREPKQLEAILATYKSLHQNPEAQTSPTFRLGDSSRLQAIQQRITDLRKSSQ